MSRRFSPAVVLLLLCAILGVVVRLGLAPGDATLAPSFQHANNVVFRFFDLLFSVAPWLVLSLAAGGVLWYLGYRREGATLAAAEIGAEVAAFIAKALVNRPRPPGAGDLADVIPTASYPSGHVTRGTAVLVVAVALLAWHRPAWRVPAIVALVVVLLVLGAARAASGEHWPSDVVGGYLLGGAVADVVLVASWWLFTPHVPTRLRQARQVRPMRRAR